MQPYPTADKINNLTGREGGGVSARYFKKVHYYNRLSEERLFSVIFMNIGLRKVKEIAN